MVCSRSERWQPMQMHGCYPKYVRMILLIIRLNKDLAASKEACCIRLEKPFFSFSFFSLGVNSHAKTPIKHVPNKNSLFRIIWFIAYVIC